MIHFKIKINKINNYQKIITKINKNLIQKIKKFQLKKNKIS